MSINTDTLALDTATILTIATGAVTMTKSFHIIAAESGTTDDLATITVGSLGFTPASLFLLLQADTGDTITVKDGTGNINLNGGADFDLVGDITLLLFYDGTNWSDTGAGGAGGSGTVTSVGLSTDASYLTVGSSPVTTAGTITLNKTAALGGNQVVATPDGTTGVADLRALVADDIPSLDTSKLTSGTLSVSRGGTGLSTITSGALMRGTGTTAVSPLSGGSTGDMPAWVGSTWVAITGTYYPIASGVLGSAAASISLSSIPSTWQSLRLVMSLRGVVVAVTDTLIIQVNSDTTAGNYFGQYMAGLNATPSAAPNNGTVASLVSTGANMVPGSTAPANSFGAVALDILDYKSTSNLKTAVGMVGHRFTTGVSGNVIYSTHGTWNSVSAITSIQISLVGGNIAAGSSYRLYGQS